MVNTLVGLGLKSLLVGMSVWWSVLCIGFAEYILDNSSEWYHYLGLIPLSFVFFMGVSGAYIGLDIPLTEKSEETSDD
jgi:hypothetical protein